MEDSQPNTETCLKDLYLRISEGGWIRQAREERRERSGDGCLEATQMFLWNSERGEESDCSVHSLYPWAFLLECSVYITAKPSDQSKDGRQEYNSYILAPSIARQKAESQSLPNYPHPPRARSKPQEKTRQWALDYKAGNPHLWELRRQLLSVKCTLWILPETGVEI